MNLGSSQLKHAMKALRERWDETEAGWQDQVRQDFDDKHLAPLERQVGATVRAMEKLAEILTKARQDCG